MTPHKYPIGLQNFGSLRKDSYYYIDKTEYIYRLTHTNGKYFFLSRPRRFGKSLLMSTMHAYFEGKKELFKGLAIERLETDWPNAPVLHFDMSLGKHMGKEQLNAYLLGQLESEEERFGLEGTSPYTNIRLTNLIRNVYEQTGQGVVVLIDEYDAPLLDVAHENEQLSVLRNVMRNFYSPLKACDPYLRFVFLTGITKFSQLSIFSELNNITNISMRPEFAGICGITQEELETQFSEDVDYMASRLGLDRQHTLEALRDHYDGYHFTWPSPDIYNPYSLLNAFDCGRLQSFWFGSGTPTILINMMQKFHVLPSQIGPVNADACDFDAPTESLTSIVPLFYQSGYLTIKAYDPDFDSYTLDIPNREVRVGLTRAFLPHYVPTDTIASGGTARELARCITKDDINGAMQLLQDFLSTVPYCDNANSEGHYQQMLYVIFSLLTNYLVEVEVRTPRGRIDLAVMTRSHIYIIELKLNRSAASALSQINLKNYAGRFALSQLPVTKVGVNFSSEERNITDWIVE